MKRSWGIQGVGLISPWGNSLVEFAQNYLAKKPAIKIIDRFDTTQSPQKSAGLIASFEPKEFMDAKANRRYDMFSKLGIVATKLASKSSTKEWSPKEFEEMGIVMTCESQSMVTAQYLDGLVREGSDLVSPKLFSVASANSSNCNVSIELGIQGPSVSVSSKFSSGFLATYTAAQLIAAGQVEHCLVGSIDYLSQILCECHGRMGLYRDESQNKAGIIPGEGAVAMILTDTEDTFGRVLGLGNETRPEKNTRWPNEFEAFLSVCEKALGGVSIDKIQSCANGVPSILEMEQQVMNRLFGPSQNLSGSFELNSFAPKLPEVIRLKNHLGESSVMPLFQAVAALCETRGTRTLIPTLSPGGIYGAMVIESNGYIESLLSATTNYKKEFEYAANA